LYYPGGGTGGRNVIFYLNSSNYAPHFPARIHFKLIPAAFIAPGIREAKRTPARRWNIAPAKSKQNIE
jgi:hypothetical protein